MPCATERLHKVHSSFRQKMHGWCSSRMLAGPKPQAQDPCQTMLLIQAQTLSTAAFRDLTEVLLMNHGRVHDPVLGQCHEHLMVTRLHDQSWASGRHG